jgi:hypothetical protein
VTESARFTPMGVVYGDAARGPAAAGEIVLQAHKATSLIVRGAGGAVYFARLLAAGEAWRGPALAGLTAEVADPSAMEAFVGGASHGRLLQTQTPLAHLGDP